MPTEQKPKRGYWYYITYYECPVCGSGGSYRERQYTEKPEDVEQRVERQERYDHCLEDDCY